MADLLEVSAIAAADAAGPLAVTCFEESEPEDEGLPAALAELVAGLAARPGWKGKSKQVLRTAAGDGRPVSLWGLGRRGELEPRDLDALIDRIADDAEAQCLERVEIALPRHPVTAGVAAAERLGRRAALAGYRFDRYRSEVRRPRTLEAVDLVAPPAAGADWHDAVTVGRWVARGVAACRDLGNSPPNEATPAWIAERAAELADEHGMAIEVLGPDELAARGMNAILAVGGGSGHPPRLVRLEWGSDDPGAPAVSLVGKGVTFDTGGISIKPSKAMDEMKWDKCGACTVLGVVRAAAELALPGRFRAYLPLVENMPDGAAYRPGDIVRCYNGKTVEVLNTDAEGRMILADALAWAAEEKPDVLLEYSTLTGAAVVALGLTGAALYSPHDSLARDLLAAAEESGERLWRMPLWSEFQEEMEGSHSDLRNIGGRWGGANLAAAFLSSFVDGAGRWAHLDIAGPAYVGSDQEGTRGATGYGVALTLAWLRRTLAAG